MLGRIRPNKSLLPPPLCDDTARSLYEGITVFTHEQLRNLEMILPHIMFDTAIKIEKDFAAEDIAEYVKRKSRHRFVGKIAVQKILRFKKHPV